MIYEIFFMCLMLWFIAFFAQKVSIISTKPFFYWTISSINNQLLVFLFITIINKTILSCSWLQRDQIMMLMLKQKPVLPRRKRLMNLEEFKIFDIAWKNSYAVPSARKLPYDSSNLPFAFLRDGFKSSYRRYSLKKWSLKISRNSQENACVTFSFLIQACILKLFFV